MAEYTRPDEFHQCFAFDLLLSPWHAGSMRRAIGEAFEHVAAQGTWPTFALNNHDTQRIVTRLGTPGRHRAPRRGRAPTCATPTDAVDLAARAPGGPAAAAGLLLAMPGAVYLYQGEELGLPEVLDLPDEVRQDPVFARTGGAQIGPRRVPRAAAVDGGRRRVRTGSRRRRRGGAVAAAAGGLGRLRRRARRTATTASMLTLYRRLIAARRDAPRRATSAELARRPRRRRRAAPWRGRRRLQRRRASRSTSPRRPGCRRSSRPRDGGRRRRRARRHHGVVRP